MSVAVEGKSLWNDVGPTEGTDHPLIFALQHQLLVTSHSSVAAFVFMSPHTVALQLL